MTMKLRDIAGCFEGEIPATIATCSAAGEPNVVTISQVHLIDDEHVAISNQFLSKTAANLAENPLATLLIPDPGCVFSYRLLTQRVRTDTDGPAFDQVSEKIELIAAMTGMVGVFDLQAIEVLQVFDVSEAPTSSASVPA